MRPGHARHSVRTVFLSDTHLGCRYAQAEPLLAFLHTVQPDYLYLVGDIIDGWRLKSRWHWRPVYSRVLSRLVELGQTGTQIRYTPGNHDAFLREFLHDYGFLEIADEFIHQAADGRNYVVLHGDRFDSVEIRAQWLSVLGAFAYDALMWTNSRVNALRNLLGLEAWQFSAALKRRVKQAVAFVSSFEERLIRHAHEAECDGIARRWLNTSPARWSWWSTHAPRLRRSWSRSLVNTGAREELREQVCSRPAPSISRE